jgi:hypothetical protein
LFGVDSTVLFQILYQPKEYFFGDYKRYKIVYRINYLYQIGYPEISAVLELIQLLEDESEQTASV